MEMKKMAFRMVVVIAISMVAELLFFQGPKLWKLYDPQYEANQRFNLLAFDTVNWKQAASGELISEYDPIMTTSINSYVDTVELIITSSQSLEYLDFFYINDEYPSYEKTFHRYESIVDNHLIISVNDYVESLRLDLGDESGLILEDIQLIVNPVVIDFSLARVIAMIVVYWAGVGLFSIQKMPDYHLNEINYNKSTKGCD